MDSFLGIDLDHLEVLTSDDVLSLAGGPRDIFLDHVWFYYKEIRDGQMTYSQFTKFTDLLDPKVDADLFEVILTANDPREGVSMILAYCLMHKTRNIDTLFTQKMSLRRKVKYEVSNLIQLHNCEHYDLCSMFIDAPINGDPDEFFSDPHPFLTDAVINCVGRLLTEPNVLTKLVMLTGCTQRAILKNLVCVLDYESSKRSNHSNGGVQECVERLCKQLIDHAIENNNYRIIEGLISMSIGKTREKAMFDTNMVLDIAAKAVARGLDKMLMICLDIDMSAELVIKFAKLNIRTDVLKTDHIFTKRVIFNLFAILVHKIDFIGVLNVIKYYSVYFTSKILQKVDWTPIKDHPKAITMIAKRLGPNFFIPSFMTLFDAPGNLNFIRKYIKALRYDIDMLDGQMLIAAAHSRNEQYLRWLIKHGADPNARNQTAYRLLSGNPLQMILKDHETFDKNMKICVTSSPSEVKKSLMDLMLDEDPNELSEKIERESRPPSRQGFMF